MVWIDSTYAQTLTPQPTITGGLGSGAGQNNPGAYEPYDYSTGDADQGIGGQNGGYGGGSTYGPVQPARIYSPSADTTGQYYSDDNGATWQWENFAPADPVGGIYQPPQQAYEDPFASWAQPYQQQSPEPAWTPGGFPQVQEAWTDFFAEPDWWSPPTPQPDLIDHRPSSSGVPGMIQFEDGSWGLPQDPNALPESYGTSPFSPEYGDEFSASQAPYFNNYTYQGPGLTGDADMGFGGSVANMPGYGYGDPEVAQWRNNPEGLQPLPYESPQDQALREILGQERRGGGFFEETGLGKAFNAAMFPSDYMSELSVDIFNPGAMQGVASGGRRSAGPLAEDLEDPQEAVSDFRNRPWYEQVALGAAVDPLNYAGGLGFAADVVDVGNLARKGGGALVDATRPVMRGLGEYGSDVLEGSMRSIGDFTGMGPGTVPTPEDLPMVFRTGQKPGSNAGVVADSSRGFNDLSTQPLFDQRHDLMVEWQNMPDIVRNMPEGQALKKQIDDLTAQLESPQPLANERLWFHSTNDTSFELPDPDLAVGQSTGITQGPGIYMAADPAKSAGRYGPRTFVSEFDGNTLDLTKQMTADVPVFDGGPTWNQIRDNLAAKLEQMAGEGHEYFSRTSKTGGPSSAAPKLLEAAQEVRMAFEPSNLWDAAGRARAEFAEAIDNHTANNYVWREALVTAVTRKIGTIPGSANEQLLGRFVGVSRKAGADYPLSIVQNHLADNGIDALFHHSPRADGDVLIVLNGEKARVVADARNAADALTKSKNLGDLKARTTKLLGDQEQLVLEPGVSFDGFDDWIAVKTGADKKWQGIVRQNEQGTWTADLGGQKIGDFPTKDDAVNQFLSTRKADIKWYDDETGAINLGALLDMSSEARQKALLAFANKATREGRPTGGVFDEIAPTEGTVRGLLRGYEGTTRTAGLELQGQLDAGRKLLKDAGVKGTWDGSRFTVKRTPEVEQLFKALHGEGTVPPKMQLVFDDLKKLVDTESTDTIASKKDFIPRDDYFYRGWKAPKATNAGGPSFGAKPGYMKPRTDATFSELLAEGWEPASWNPYEMVALRRKAGVEYRSQQALVEKLKDIGQAIPEDLAPKDGWRVPRIGPAFEGKPFAFIPNTTGLADEASQAAMGQTQRLAVPEKVAGTLENIYGRQPNMGALGAVLSAGQTAKQAKLMASLFQQVDFTGRTLGSLIGGAIDEIAEAGIDAVKLNPIQASKHLFDAGKKLMKVPLEPAKLIGSNVSGGWQRHLRDEVLSGKAIFKERPGITLRGVSENGWNTTDLSLVTRGIQKELRDAMKPQGAFREFVGDVTGPALRPLRRINAATQRGLFDGVYVEAQTTALKNLILPRIMRQHKDWTDAQIMAGAADEVNKMFSTLGNYQSIIQNPFVKEVSRGLIFSTNETESLLRGAASSVVGPNKRLWAEYWAGAFLGLAATANLVHYAATGEWLPAERYNPIEKTKYGGVGGLGYNPKFLAPDVGLKGRGGTKVSLDLVGQLDTVFRLLDPKSFVEARENVLPRAIVNQWKGEDFFGDPLDSPGKRLGQFASDVIEPIGVGQIRGALGIGGPGGEPRLGPTGQLIQGAGVNLRAETTPQLRQRLAEAVGKDDWKLVDSVDKDRLRKEFPDEMAEIDRRTGESAAKGEPFAVETVDNRARVEELTNTRLGKQAEIDAKFVSGEWTGDQWKDARNTWLTDLRIRKDEIYAGIPEKDAAYRGVLDNFYGEIDKAVDPLTGKVDWDRVDEWLAQQSQTDRDRIDTASGFSKRTPVEEQYRAATKEIDVSGYFDMRDKLWGELNVTAPVPGYTEGMGYYEWKDLQKAEYAKTYKAANPGATDLEARLEAEERFDNVTDNPVIARFIQAFEGTSTKPGLYKERGLYPWAQAHPDEFIKAVEWGFLDNPDSKLEPYLYQLLRSRQ